ncbi:MAG: response regulator transcription factor [Gemmatimonadota bacterium]|nr:response regulator transcription factor [Gemmatimonadota bacterium]
MRKIMLLTASGDKELASELSRDLKRLDLDFELLCPKQGKENDLAGLEQVDLFVLAGRDAGRLESLASSLKRDDLLSEVPRLVVTEEKTLRELDYCRLADDILLLPYRLTELEARVRMLSWRNQEVDPSNLVRAGELHLNLLTYEVTAGGVLIDLTFKEYELLRYMITHRKRVHTRQDLLTRVWGEDYYGGARTVDVHIRRIRAKIETGGRVYIQTVRGVGYRFVD